MAGKLQNDKDIGRCERCSLSYVNAVRKHRTCYRFGQPCARVAWNCTALSSGYVEDDIKPEHLKEIERLRQIVGNVTPTVEKFLAEMPVADEAKSNWLIDREAELELSGYDPKEAKEKALLDWDTYMESNSLTEQG